MKQLSIKEVALQAAWRCWGLRRELLSVMIIPIAAYLALGIAASMLEAEGTAARYAYWGCCLVVSALAAISCHRVLLLGPVSVPKFGVGHLGKRELSFIVAALFLAFVVGLLQLFGEFVLTSITGIGDSEGERRSLTLHIISWLPGSYLFARLAFMMPSIAIETRARIPETWQLSRGNGWRLTILVVLLPWLVHLLEWGIAVALPGETVGTIAQTTLYALFLPLEIALLSVSYRHLIE